MPGVEAPDWLAGNIPRKPGFLRVVPGTFPRLAWQIEAPEYLGTHHPSVMQWILNSNTFTNIVFYI